MARGLRPSLSQGVTLLISFTKGFTVLQVSHHSKKKSELNLKVQDPDPHQDPDFITVLYHKPVTSSSGEQV